MPIEKISDVPVGAILARSVEDSMGRTLISSGEALTEQLIAVLKKRGFVEVEIRPPATVNARDIATTRIMTRLGMSEDTLSNTAGISELRDEVARRFDTVPASRAMTALRHAVEHLLVDRQLKRGRRG